MENFAHPLSNDKNVVHFSFCLVSSLSDENLTFINTRSQIPQVLHLKRHQSMVENISIFHLNLGFSSKGQSDVTVETKMYVLKSDPFGAWIKAA